MIENYTCCLHAKIIILFGHKFIVSNALTLLVGRQDGHLMYKNEWWGAGMVICLAQDADLHMAQLIPLPLTVSCSRKSRLVLVLFFWYRLTRVVPYKIKRAVK